MPRERDTLHEPVRTTTSPQEIGRLYRACLELAAQDKPEPNPIPKRIYPDWLRSVGESQITPRDKQWAKAGHEIH